MKILSIARLTVISGISLIVMAVCAGCAVESPQEFDLHGTVTLLDGTCQPVPDASGVTVTMEGTTRSATTDANGNWSLGNAPAGTYKLAYSKPGYPSATNEHSEFYPDAAGAANFNKRVDYSIAQRSSLGVTLETSILHQDTLPAADSLIRDILVAKCSLVLPPGVTDKSAPVYLFLDTTSAINPINPMYYSIYYTGMTTDGKYEFELPINLWSQKHWHHGSTVYAVAYVGRLCDYEPANSYMNDIQSSISLNHSEVQSFVLP